MALTFYSGNQKQNPTFANMSKQDRYDRLLEAIEWERKTEETYFKQLQSKKTIPENFWYPKLQNKSICRHPHLVIILKNTL